MSFTNNEGVELLSKLTQQGNSRDWESEQENLIMNEARMTFFTCKTLGCIIPLGFTRLHFCAPVFNHKYKHKMKLKITATGNDPIRKIPKLLWIIRWCLKQTLATHTFHWIGTFAHPSINIHSLFLIFTCKVVSNFYKLITRYTDCQLSFLFYYFKGYCFKVQHCIFQCNISQCDY